MPAASREREVWEMMDRRYSESQQPSTPTPLGPGASEDLHAWSIYRQNLNSDFTDSALGSSEKSPLPYGNFQLRESTVQSILSHPRYGPKSPLGSNMYTYLKFGLPRVFPPNGVRGAREGSSGYDSSEDGASHRGPRTAAEKKARAQYLRARSDPDFRNLIPNGPTAHRNHPPSSALGAPRMAPRGKSISEANLLQPEIHMPHHRSMHELRSFEVAQHHPAAQRGFLDVHHPGHPFRGGRPASIAIPNSHQMQQPLNPRMLHVPGSHLHERAASALSHSHLDGGGVPSFQSGRSEFFPSLQVRGLEVAPSSRNKCFVQGVSFEVKGSEVLAIMSTSALEGKAILDGLAGRNDAKAFQVILNGHSIPLNALKRRMVYVRSQSFLSPDLNVAQTLTFYSHLRRPPKHSIKVTTSEQMGLLIEELGLTQVLSTRVGRLTISELKRLSIACCLMSHADILLLDSPTVFMDIFDTFFLVEFLRGWASGGPAGMAGKMVILTLQPPTYEIFTMISRVLLVSGGRTMYSGKRRDMLPYFAAADYPCPAFKNPSDYYLDLVTLDDLSAEAMLESSQRIEQLSELFRRREEPLSDPPLPHLLIPKIGSASPLRQVFALFLRQMAYSQPSSLLNWLSQLLIATILSVMIGCIFWDVPSSDSQLLLNDRFGYHFTIMCLVSWPLLISLSMARCHGHDRAAVESDIKDGLYSRAVYIIVMLCCSIPASLVIWLGLVIPAYAMSGLYIQGPDTEAFYIYVVYTILYLSCMQTLFITIGFLTPSRAVATLISGLVSSLIALTSGVPVHIKDLIPSLSLTTQLSPARWIMLAVLSREYSPPVLSSYSANMLCRNKQVQHQDIIVQLPCPPPNGTAALSYVGFLPQGEENYWAVPSIFWAVCLGACVVIFVALGSLCKQKVKVKK
ncbi:hypothetical protein WDU94_004059 [Cyamophila willieti]